MMIYHQDGGDSIDNVYLSIVLQGISLKRKDYTKIPSGNKNYIWINATISSDWEGEDIYIQFSKCRIVSNVLLVEGKCQIPEWCMEQPGEFYIRAYAGELKTANSVMVEVFESGYSTGKTPPPPPEKTYVITESDKVLSLRETDGKFEYYSDKEKIWKDVQASSALRYVHVQEEPATVWHVQHNLGQLYVNTKIMNDSNEEIVGYIDYPNSTENLLQIQFANPITGNAYITY